MIDLVVLLVLGAAAFRLTRFLVIDTVFEGYRAKFHVFLHNQAAKDGKVSLFWGKLLELTTCTWCLGFWTSLALYSVYVLQYPWDLGRLGWISVLAVAGIQGLLHAFEPGDE